MITNNDGKLSTKIRTFLGRDNIDFTEDIILMDNGDGIQFIKEWNVPEEQPTQEEIDAL